MPASAGSSPSTASFRLPLFWQLQLVGWSGFSLIALPLKQAVYGSMAGGLLITAYQLPLSVALTAALRVFYRRTRPTRRPHWQAALLVLAGCATASCVDVLVSVPVNHFFGLFGPADILGVGLYFFRTAVYVIWSLAYFLIKALLHSREQAFQVAVAQEKHRFEILRYQLNPGFLAKSLATISREMAENPVTARAMTVLLSDYYQNTVRQSDQGRPTTIGDEVALLRTYLEIERLHRPEALRVHFDVDSSLMDHPLPPILLLPLAEKAIKDGRGTPAQPLEITITVQRAPDGLVLLEVANSGRVRDTHPPVTGPDSSDVADVRASLERYYPGRHRFALTQDSFMARATLCVPLVA
jgi:hypothetical protein